jgi:hypothetical protein
MTGRQATLLAALLLIPLAGCRPRNAAQYVPQSADAREALETVLNAWKKGEPAGSIKGHKPPIDVVDSKRKPGEKLTAYEITGEDATSEGHHRFAVKLTLQPGGTQEDHYVVLGLDPLWVYREDDYKKLSGQ